MHTYAAIARALAAAFLADELRVEPLVDRGARLLGKRFRWLKPLAGRICDRYGGRARPRQVELAGYLLADLGFRRAAHKHSLQLVGRLAAQPAWPTGSRSRRPNWTGSPTCRPGNTNETAAPSGTIAIAC